MTTLPRSSQIALLVFALATPAGAQQPVRSHPVFDVTETTIAEIHSAMRAGSLTCRALVSSYLQRIAAYDKAGPAINSLIVVNPAALTVADSLDRRFATGGMTGPLHCIPVIVKDNFETRDLPTTVGSLSLQGMIPRQDAFMVRRIREAGAIVLAKSNMAEFAFTPYETVSSILPGYTKNPYALDRVTAGSSGDTIERVGILRIAGKNRAHRLVRGESELRHVRLGEHDRSRFPDASHHECILTRDHALERERAYCGWKIARFEVVLHDDRNAV